MLHHLHTKMLSCTKKYLLLRLLLWMLACFIRDVRMRRGERKTSGGQKQSHYTAGWIEWGRLGPDHVQSGGSRCSCFLFSLSLDTNTAWQHTLGTNQERALKTKSNHHAVSLIGFSQVCAPLRLPSALTSEALHTTELFFSFSFSSVVLCFCQFTAFHEISRFSTFTDARHTCSLALLLKLFVSKRKKALQKKRFCKNVPLGVWRLMVSRGWMHAGIWKNSTQAEWNTTG